MAALSAGADRSRAVIGASVERLAQLQNLVKRDPDTYGEEVALQHRNFLAELEILRLRPGAASESFRALVGFLAAVAPCYKVALAALPGQLVALLAGHAEALEPEARRAVAQALMLLRNRGLVESLPLLRVFFGLFRVRDKYLRALVFGHIVHDIRRLNEKRSDEGANRALQGAMYGLLADANTSTAKKSLDVMVELYRRRVWTDARTVNVIAGALASPKAKLLVTALKFFLGLDGSGGGSAGDGNGSGSDDDDSSDDDEDEDGKKKAPKKKARPVAGSRQDAQSMREAKALHQHSKGTRRRERQTARAVTSLRKMSDRAGAASSPLWPARQLLHDPQGTAEKLFAALRTSRERFEVRLLMMTLVSRLIGQHRLLLLPFYSFAQKYLAAHQGSVTHVLAFLIQVRRGGGPRCVWCVSEECALLLCSLRWFTCALPATDF